MDGTGPARLSSVTRFENRVSPTDVKYLDEFGSRQIAYVAVSESGSCGFSTKARQMGTKGGPAHSTPLHELGQAVALEEVGKFVRQLAHKNSLL